MQKLTEKDIKTNRVIMAYFAAVTLFFGYLAFFGDLRIKDI